MIINRLKAKVKDNDSLYGIYLYFFHRQYYLHKKREWLFYKRLISPGALVFDIGANIGNKSKLFAGLGSPVIALEPDQTNYDSLIRRFRSKKQIRVLPLAVSHSKGVAKFYMLEPGSAYNTLNLKWKETLEDPQANRWHDSRNFQKEVEVPTTTIDALIDEFGIPEFIKIDVEGNELSCIQGLSQRVGLISFEANLPEFKNETLRILDHLNNIDKNVRFNYMRDDETFEFPQHLSHNEFYRFLESTGIRYMEIFSFMNK